MSGSLSPLQSKEIQDKNAKTAEAEAKDDAFALSVIGVELAAGLGVWIGTYLQDIWDFLEHNDKQLVVVATFGLFLVTFFLARYTLDLWRATKTLAEDARTSGEAQRLVMAAQQTAMEGQVSALGAIATAVADSATAARDAAGVVREQVATMKWMRVAQFPPQLAVTNITITMVEPSGDVIIDYTVINRGNTKARITATRTVDAFGLALGDVTRGEPVNDEPSIVGANLGPRFGKRGAHLCTAIRQAAYSDVMAQRNPRPILHFAGWINYVDENETDSTFPFHRTYDALTGTFSEVDDN